MTVEVGDKVVLVPLSGGGQVAVKSGAIEEGDKVLLIPLSGGGQVAVKLASPAVGEKVILYPLSNGGFVCLRSDSRIPYRSVVAWGDNTYGQCDIPDCFTASNVPTDIDCGLYHVLALMPDKSVIAWGDNRWGQCDVPAGLQAEKISAGGTSSMALTTDGDIVIWGSMNLTVTGLDPIVSISVFGSHALALTDSGTGIGWGDNWSGALWIPSGVTLSALSAGGTFSVFLSTSGDVYVSSRYNYYNEQNIPSGLVATDVSAGSVNCLALNTDGDAIAWGGVGDYSYPDEWRTDGINRADAGGGAHNVVLTNAGKVISWGHWVPAPDDLVATRATGGWKFSAAILGTILSINWSKFVYSYSGRFVYIGGGLEVSALHPTGVTGGNCRSLSFTSNQVSDPNYGEANATATMDGGGFRLTGWVGCKISNQPEYGGIRIQVNGTSILFRRDTDFGGSVGSIQWEYVDLLLGSAALEEYTLRFQRFHTVQYQETCYAYFYDMQITPSTS
jgi:hypothetical protein